MYIKRIYLEKIRCFDKLELEFPKPGTSALFLGDNGDGKSTILRCLAMGLCDRSSASALFRELSGPFVRHAPDRPPPSAGEKGYIKIDLHNGDGEAYQIDTEIEIVHDFETVDQHLWKIEGDSKEPVGPLEFPWDRVFVAGYGPGLRTAGTQDYPRYVAVNAVYPLFVNDQPLQNPELIILRLLRTYGERPLWNNIQLLMAELLDLKSPGDFELTTTGLTVTSFWGTAGLSQLGDGYQATITWVLDLISSWFLRESANTNGVLELESVKGIAIIDEIEQHLHPKWQRRILPSLIRRFPNVQFVVATHSPLVASSSKDVEVHQLREGRRLQKVKPYGWLAENVYSMMGLHSRPEQFEEETLARYTELDRKKVEGTATRDEIEEWKRTTEVLVAMLPEGDPIAVSMRVANMLESLNAKGGTQD